MSTVVEQQSTVGSTNENLPRANVRPQGGFPDAEFVTIPNVPVFAEHTATRKDGTKLAFGLDELRLICERCNRRIRETGDYASLSLGHTPDPGDANGEEPPVVGYAGPFQVGLLGEPGVQQKYAILADFHVHRSDADNVRKRYTRRSPELWLADSYEEMFLDPIALLSSKPPKLDMGLLYAAEYQGRTVEKYTAVAPAAGSVFVPSDDYAKQFDESKHPRDESGKFGEKGGGGAETPSKPATVKPITKKTASQVTVAEGSYAGIYKRQLVGSREQWVNLAKPDSMPLPGSTMKKWLDTGKATEATTGEKSPTKKPAAKSKVKLPQVKQVRLVKLTTSGGKHIRKATVVEFEDGRSIQFMERIPKAQAIEQAQEQLRKQSPEHYEKEQYMLDPDEIQQLLQALDQLDWVQQMKTLAATQAGANTTPAPMGEVPAPVPTAAAPPPMAAPAAPPVAEAPPGVPPEAAPTEAPPPAQVPPEPPRDKGALPLRHAKEDKEEGDETVESKELYAILDDMSDEEIDEYCKGRKIGKYAEEEGTVQSPDPGKPTSNATVETQGDPPEGSAHEEGSNPKDHFAREGEKGNYAMNLGEVGHKLKELEGQVEQLKAQLGEEQGKRIDAERYSALADRRQHYAFDLDKEVERCKYEKMNMDQFDQHIEVIEQNYRKIPVGESLPLHGRGIDRATAGALGMETEPAKYEKAKAQGEQALKLCLERAANDEPHDYATVLAEIQSKDGEPATK